MKLFAKNFIILAFILLEGCGESGGKPSSGTTISGKVVDGYVKGATVCLDVNSNGICDPSEPTATTDVTGSFTFKYSGSTSGLNVIALVPTGAVDSDTGAVINGYRLATPASSPSVVSILTTMVSNLVLLNPSLTATQAEKNIIVTNNLPTTSVLGFDVTSNATMHTIAQVATKALSSLTASLTSNTTFQSAASKNGSVATQAQTQAINELQTSVLPALQNGDGSINTSYLTNGQPNNNAIATLSGNTVSSQIKTIYTSTILGPKITPISIQNELPIYTIEKNQGATYIDSNGNRIGIQNGIFKVSGITISNAPAQILVNNAWYADGDYSFDLTSSGWLQENPSSVTFADNCLSIPFVPNVVGKACITAYDASTLPMSAFFLDCKDPQGNAIGGCNVNATFPSGSRAYTLSISYSNDQYQLHPTQNSSGYPNGITDVNGFIAYLTNNPMGFRYSSDNVCELISVQSGSYNITTRQGTVNITSSPSRQGCVAGGALIDEKPVLFEVITIGSTDVFKVNNFKGNSKANDGLVFFAFANIPSINASGIFQGQLYETGITSILLGLPTFNKTAYNFVAHQYGFPALPSE